MILKDTIHINASSECVYENLLFFMKDKASYLSWHPEHKDINWIKGNPLEEGSIVCIEEYLQDVLHKLTFKFIKMIPNRLIIYRVLFPLSIIAPYNKFIIDPTGDDSCSFTAMGKINMPKWLFLMSHKYHKEKLEAGLSHMKGEGQKLKQVSENKS